MKAKILVYALLAIILATIHLAEAQQPAKIPKIGWLQPGYRQSGRDIPAEFANLVM